MTSAPQPNEVGYAADAALEARTVHPDVVDEDQPEYAGDLPDDPEQAKHYRPGEENA